MLGAGVLPVLLLNPKMGFSERQDKARAWADPDASRVHSAERKRPSKTTRAVIHSYDICKRPCPGTEKRTVWPKEGEFGKFCH